MVLISYCLIVYLVINLQTAFRNENHCILLRLILTLAVSLSIISIFFFISKHAVLVIVDPRLIEEHSSLCLRSSRVKSTHKFWYGFYRRDMLIKSLFYNPTAYLCQLAIHNVIKRIGPVIIGTFKPLYVRDNLS